MPVHDWTRVDAGVFQSFALHWLSGVSGWLNQTLNPKSHYALISPAYFHPSDYDYLNPGPDPNVAYVRRQKRVTVHAIPGDRVVATVELPGPCLKRCPGWLRTFVLRQREAIWAGINSCVVDLLPPIPAAPHGVHRLVWAPFHLTPFEFPPDKPLTLAAYAAGPVKRAFVEPVAVGDDLPELPLFLTPEMYVPVPLNATYLEAWGKVPKPWREVLESPA